MNALVEKEVLDYGHPDVEKFLCENRLDYLCRVVLGFSDWDICHDRLKVFLETSKKRKKLILMSRGHLKTSVVTIGLSIQKLLNDFDATILLTNAVWGNAVSFLSEIREYLTSKSLLPRLYGNFESQKWTQDEIVVSQRRRANKTPTFSTAGIDTALASQHYKYIFADDTVNRQTISTQEQRDKNWKFYSDLLDLLEPDGELFVVGTRWHDSDLYGRILREEKDQWDVFEIGATENGEIDGQIMFPKKFNVQILKDLLKSKGSYEFYAQYFNKCLSEETQHFKPPVRYWEELGSGATHYITFDPATSEKKGACDAVVMDACITRANQMCAVEYTAFKDKNPDQMIARIFEYASKHRVGTVGVETNGGQEIYVKLIEEEMRRRNVFFKLVPIHQHQDKFSRIIALQSRWESGNLLLKQGMVELQDQFLRFPVSDKLDILDAMAMVQQIAEPVFAERAKVFIPKEYR